MNLDYITQETERDKKEKKYLNESGETGKPQFKRNIVRGKEEELKADIEKTKHQKVKVKNSKEMEMVEVKQISKQDAKMLRK